MLKPISIWAIVEDCPNADFNKSINNSIFTIFIDTEEFDIHYELMNYHIKLNGIY